MKKGLSLYWQTLLLIVASLIVTQVVSISLILILPPPRPDFISMSEIADTLAARPAPVSFYDRNGHVPPRTGLVHMQAGPPVPNINMVVDKTLTVDLAQRIGVDPAHVQLNFVPDRDRLMIMFNHQPDALVPEHNHEALFFNTMIAGLDTGHGWRVMQSPKRFWISDWQIFAIILLVVSIAAMSALAWFFARRLSRPIHHFAEAADRLGREANAPPLSIAGPQELRTAAHTLNTMQKRINAYLNERTAMIGAIAHDLRTPLARIAFRIENAEDAIRAPVQQDIEQMRQMIAATMDFVKGAAQSKAFAPIDLGALLAHMAEKEREMGHAVALAPPPLLPGSPAHINGDGIALQRLFQNLIDNALAFGGAAEIALNEADQALTITISDHGSGLSEDMLETVFDPFVRNDPSRNRATGGVGLGLTIARSIARDHGGTLTLANRVGGGLVATVTLLLA